MSQTPSQSHGKLSTGQIWIRAFAVLAILYGFLLSIDLMGDSFKLFGKGFATQLVASTRNPLVGLFIGILATSLVQSSSTTTSLVVGLVASGALDVRVAIPMIMGANVGTTITNTLVSFGFVARKEDFRRAFAGATVHDFFNLLSLAVLFPLEVALHPIERIARWVTGSASTGEVDKLANPLKAMLKPVAEGVVHVFTEVIPLKHQVAAVVILVLALTLMFGSLIMLVKLMRQLLLRQAEEAINRYLFRNDFTAFLLGLMLTVAVQSSSITTSLIVPMVGAGIVSVRRCYPFTLGANVGTTCTALLASMAGDKIDGVTVAVAHLTFNVMGILIWYPLRRVPIFLAEHLADLAVKSKAYALAFIAAVFFGIPAVAVVIEKILEEPAPPAISAPGEAGSVSTDTAAAIVPVAPAGPPDGADPAAAPPTPGTDSAAASPLSPASKEPQAE